MTNNFRNEQYVFSTLRNDNKIIIVINNVNQQSQGSEDKKKKIANSCLN